MKTQHAKMEETLSSAAGCVSFAYLLRGVIKEENDTGLYKTLKIIYQRLQKGERCPNIPTTAVSNICLLLRIESRNPCVKVLLCHVVNLLCLREAIAVIFIKHDLLTIIHELLLNWTSRQNGNLSEAEIHLLESELFLLETISHHHVLFFTDFTKLNFLEFLCTLCQPECAVTYGYGAESYASFRKLTDDIYPGLVGRVSRVDNDIKYNAYNKCFGVQLSGTMLHVPCAVLYVELKDTSDTPHKYIAAEMCKLNGSWPSLKDVVPALMEDSGGGGGGSEAVVERKERELDVYITYIVDGCHFWAQLGGTTSTCKVQKISSILSSISNGKSLQNVPVAGMTLAIFNSEFGYYRGWVLDVQDEMVDVHAIDFGFRKMLHWKHDEMFEIVSDMGLDNFEPQAVLCILKDVSPPPLNTCTLISIAAILRNLAAEAKTSSDMFSKLEVIQTLQYLAGCPEPEVARTAAQAFSNMAYRDRIRFKLNSQNTLTVLMVKLKEYFYLMSEEPFAKAVYSILGAINNLVCETAAGWDEFFTNKGSELMIRMIDKSSPEKVRTAACRVVAMLVGNAIPTLVITNIFERKSFAISKTALAAIQQSINAIGIKRLSFYRALDNAQTSQQLPLSSGHDSGERKKSNTTYIKNAILDDRRQGCISNEDLADGPPTCAELISSLVGKNRIKSAGDSSDQEVLTSLARSFTAGGDDSLLALNNAVVYQHFNKNSHYVQGRQMPFQCDLHHDLRQYSDVGKISKNIILQSICGLLNTADGGSIYIGLLQTAAVYGIIVDRSQRDVLRTSVDMAVSTLVPSLFSSMYDIIFHPIVQYVQETGDYISLQDLKIIEIKVESGIDTLYTLSNGEIMMRIGDKTQEITMQDLCVKSTLEAEERMFSTIEALERELELWNRNCKCTLSQRMASAD